MVSATTAQDTAHCVIRYSVRTLPGTSLHPLCSPSVLRLHSSQPRLQHTSHEHLALLHLNNRRQEISLQLQHIRLTLQTLILSDH